jgi:rhodanese-related sulfurtransferase
MRIEPDELDELLASDTDVALFDLRNALAIELDPRRIPSAEVMNLEDLDARHEEIPRDREIVLYCS